MSQNNAFANYMSIIGDFIKEAWHKVSGVKWLFFVSGILLPFVYFIGLFFTTGYLITVMFEKHTHALLYIFLFGMLIIALLVLIIFFGLFFIIALNFILGLRRAIGLPLSIKTASAQFFQNFGSIFIIFLLWFGLTAGMIFVAMIFADGIFLRVINGLIMYILILPLFGITLPFIITKRDSAFTALLKTFQMMKEQGLIIISATLLMEVIVVISMIPLGLGIIWTAPMFYILLGLLFRNATGLRLLPSG